MATTVFFSDGPFSYYGIVLEATSLPLTSQITAAQYLDYAQKDFRAGRDHGLVNAMGNAKRALHLMIDTLLHNYGLLTHNRRCDFGRKLRLLDACGLISLSIFRKLNVERNAMEHEFQVPDAEAVSDAIDVCQLLLLAIGNLCHNVPIEGTVGLRDSGKHGLLRLDRSAGRLTVTEFLDPELSTIAMFGSDVEYVTPIFHEGSRTPPASSLAAEPLLDLPLKLGSSETWAPGLQRLVGLRNRSEDSTVDELPAYSIQFHVRPEQTPSIAEFLSYVRQKTASTVD
ncbi:hypothetical protein [Actinoplanes sp. NPDC051411]|uniref:hypothetical protein n=1 Tax=Actinoplanes sp. NPDC051411 TaxID=3155522 RepID=UPI00343D1286